MARRWCARNPGIDCLPPCSKRCSKSRLKPANRSPLEVEQKLLKVTPKEYLRDAHHLLILHGRYVCLARKPKCGECVIRDLCEYKAKELA